VSSVYRQIFFKQKIFKIYYIILVSAIISKPQTSYITFENLQDLCGLAIRFGKRGIFKLVRQCENILDAKKGLLRKLTFMHPGCCGSGIRDIVSKVMDGWRCPTVYVLMSVR